MGAIARIYKPGIKYDTMVILYGKQGGGKSTLASRMGGQWYNQSINTFKGDEAYKSYKVHGFVKLKNYQPFKNLLLKILRVLSVRLLIFTELHTANVLRDTHVKVFL